MKKKKWRRFFILIVVETLLISGGFVADIIYWKWVFAAKDIVGHGVPFLSIIGIVVALIFGIIFSIVIDKKEKIRGKK